MNIDLLLTEQGDAGLVCDGGFDSPVSGAIFDAETCQFYLEFSDLNSMELNIPVESETAGHLLWATAIQVGVIEHGKIQDNHQVALMLLNDPYGEPGMDNPVRPGRSVTAFEQFLKSCVIGQPVHRDDLGNEASAESVVAGINRAVLQFAPHLARQRTLEAAPNLAQGPRGPGPSGPGGMGSGGGGGSAQPPLRQRRDPDGKNTGGRSGNEDD